MELRQVSCVTSWFPRTVSGRLHRISGLLLTTLHVFLVQLAGVASRHLEGFSTGLPQGQLFLAQAQTPSCLGTTGFDQALIHRRVGLDPLVP